MKHARCRYEMNTQGSATFRIRTMYNYNAAPFKANFLFRISLTALNTRKLILTLLDKPRLKSAVTAVIVKAIHCTE